MPHPASWATAATGPLSQIDKATSVFDQATDRSVSTNRTPLLTLSSCTGICVDLLHAIFGLESSDELCLILQWVDDAIHLDESATEKPSG
jgi:hypothetical protein